MNEYGNKIHPADLLSTNHITERIANCAFKNILEEHYDESYDYINEKLKNFRVKNSAKYVTTDLIDTFDKRKTHFLPNWKFDGIVMHKTEHFPKKDDGRVLREAEEHINNGSIVVFTDGSHQNDGANNCAGIGVYFYKNYKIKNVSEPLPPEIEPSGQNAELYAIIKALDLTVNNWDRKLAIFTDYSEVKHIFEKYKGVKINPDDEKRLIEDNVKLELLCKLSKRDVEFHFLKSMSIFNDSAHKLAYVGAKKKMPKKE